MQVMCLSAGWERRTQEMAHNCLVMLSNESFIFSAFGWGSLHPSPGAHHREVVGKERSLWDSLHLILISENEKVVIGHRWALPQKAVFTAFSRMGDKNCNDPDLALLEQDMMCLRDQKWFNKRSGSTHPTETVF